MAKLEPIRNPGVTFVPFPKNKESGIDAYKRQTDKRFEGIERLTRTVLWVGIITLVSVVVAVVGLIIDQMRFNNSLYRQRANENQMQIENLQNQINILKAKK